MAYRVLCIRGHIETVYSAKTMTDAREACRMHLGVSRLTAKMKGSMCHRDDMEGQGWEEVASWFSSDRDDAACAAIYRKSTRFWD